jgi:hypothetical protein
MSAWSTMRERASTTWQVEQQMSPLHTPRLGTQTRPTQPWALGTIFTTHLRGSEAGDDLIHKLVTSSESTQVLWQTEVISVTYPPPCNSSRPVRWIERRCQATTLWGDDPVKDKCDTWQPPRHVISDQWRLDDNGWDVPQQPRREPRPGHDPLCKANTTSHCEVTGPQVHGGPGNDKPRYTYTGRVSAWATPCSVRALV